MIGNFFNENMLQALGWTLIHSLWQGAIIAIILGITLVLLRKNSSKVRYFVSATALFTLFLLSVITFFSIYQNSHPKTNKHLVLLEVNSSPLTNTNVAVENGQATVWGFSEYLQYFGSYFEEHLPLIVTVWTLGVLILLLRFMGAFAYLQRMKSYKTNPASREWQHKVNEISEKINLQKKVQLLESSIAKVPMVIGFFKPVVLVPIGTLTGLSAQQVENILAHELAHIVRNDYLVNMIQSIVEIVLFFNPLVWWISGKVREERENCCDDIAIQTTGDRLTFVQALASLEEMRINTPELAVALNGQGSLLGRIKRLANQKVRTATFSEGLIAGLVLILFLFSASFEADAKGKEEIKTNTSEASGPKNAIPYRQITKDDTIRFGKGFMLVTDNGKHKLFKDGVEIQEEDYEKYKNDFSIQDKTIRLGSAEQENPITITLDDTPAKEHILFEMRDDKVIQNNFDDLSKFDFNFDFSNTDSSFTIKKGNGENIVLEFKDEINTGKKGFVIKNGNAVVFDMNNLEDFLEENFANFDELKDIQLNPEDIKWSEEDKQKFKEEIEKARKNIKKAQIEIQKANEDIKNRIIIVERDNKANIEEELKKVKKERKSQEEGFVKFKEQLLTDGLVAESDKEVSVKIKDNEIQINGKKLKGKEAEKYKKLLKEYLKVDTEKVKGTWHWKTIF